MFSIIIPTWNNLDYLKCCVESIQKNSNFKHQIILHINDGKDGTLDWAKQNNILYTYSINNIGICNAVNNAANIATEDYIMYMNDDMYCLPNWDEALIKYIQSSLENNFMLSATLIEPTNTKNNCVIEKNFGRNPAEFQEQDLINFAKTIENNNWSGSFWPPNLIPKKLWNTIGGFSPEFSPGMSSDDDFVHKCWQAGCRIFIGIGNSFVYHFQGKSTQRIIKNNGRLQYLQKWKITQSSFRKYYLRLGKPVLTQLQNPNKLLVFLLKLKGWIKLRMIN